MPTRLDSAVRPATYGRPHDLPLGGPRPYRLGLTTSQRLAASGPLRLLQQLLLVPGATAHGIEGHLEYVSLPGTRGGVLACEMLAAPESMAASYLNARALLLEPEASDVQWVLEHLGHLPLLSHQLAFVAFAHRATGALCADEQGVGKTRSALALLQAWGVTRALVVAPKSLLPQWTAEAMELWPNASERPFALWQPHGSVSQRVKQLQAIKVDQRGETSACVVMINYEVLADLVPAIEQFEPQALVCDESWRLKSPTAKVTRAAWRVGANCNRVLCLAGTPYGNDVGDLYSQLRLVAPHVWSQWSYWDFMQRYCKFRQVPVGRGRVVAKPEGCQDPVGLAAAVGPVWWRTPKAACFELPPSRYETVRLDLPADTAQLYARVREEGEFALGHELSLADERVVLLRLQQLADGLVPRWGLPSTNQEAEGSQEITTEEWLDVAERAGDGQGWLLRHAESDPKLEWLLEFARERLLPNPQSRAIIWYRFNAALRRHADLLEQMLPATPNVTGRVAMVTGETRDLALEAVKESFNSRDPDGVQVICAQVKKLCAGHNLQAADYQVFASHTWSYLERSQAESRSHRLGREGGVTYIDLVARGTIDEAIIAALRRKESLAERLAVATTST